MSIFSNDTNLASSIGFDGFDSLASAGGVGDKYKFIKFMSFKIYERIFNSCVNELAMTKKQADIVKASGANSYAPYTEGFIYHLARSASQKSKVTIYMETMADGEKIFSSSAGDSATAKTIELDFTDFDEAGLVSRACALIYEVLNSATQGLIASKTILMKLEKLAEQLADKQAIKAVGEQIKIFEESVKSGRVAYVSSNSSAEFMTYDSTLAKTNLGFCYEFLSIITGYPAEFFNGVGGSSLSDTGESAKQAIRRGDEHYSLAVIIPFVKKVFGYKLDLKPVFDNIDSLYSAISFIETTDILTREDKQKILMYYGLSGDGIKEGDKKPELPEINGNPNAPIDESEDE